MRSATGDLPPPMLIDHVNALPPGTRFEEYRLDVVLGAGGSAFTWSMGMGRNKPPASMDGFQADCRAGQERVSMLLSRELFNWKISMGSY